jgi:hypothetical protein
MQLTFNKFKQVVDKSSEKIFGKISEALAASDNAALVSMYDDKLIILDEEKENFYLADYVFENGILSMKNFEQIGLTENDDTYLNKVVDKLFDLDDESPITIGEMMTGLNLQFKNNSHKILHEAKDNKYRKIMESPRIRAIKKAREVRNMFVEDIKNLMEEDFIGKLQLKTDGDTKNAIPSTLTRVKWNSPYSTSVNTEQGQPVNMIKIKDNANVMDAMTNVAAHLSDKWKSDSFRSKFEKMVKEILATESVELAKTAVLSFLDENKELFLLKKTLFEELITKTTLMVGEGDSDTVVKIFESIVDSKPGRQMRREYFRKNNLTEEKINEINRLAEEEDLPEPKKLEGGDDDSSSSDDSSTDLGDKEEGTSDLDTEEVNKIIDIFKKISKQLESDSSEAEYIQGLISSLDSAKIKGIEDSKMKEIIDFLSSAKAPKKDDEDDSDSDDEDESDEDDDDSDEEVEI